MRCIHISIALLTGMCFSFNCFAVDRAASSLPHLIFYTSSVKPIEPSKFSFCPDFRLFSLKEDKGQRHDNVWPRLFVDYDYFVIAFLGKKKYRL